MGREKRQLVSGMSFEAPVEGPQQGQEQQEGAEASNQFSTRDVVFLVVYCWLLAITMMNAVVSIFHPEGRWRHVSDVANCWLWMLVVLVVLVVHSAVSSVPNYQPFRLAM